MRRPSVLALCLVAAGCGGSAATSTGTRSSGVTGARTTTAPTTTQTATALPPPPKPKPRPKPPDPGSLPQTAALPSADTPRFRAEMAALWHGIKTDSAQAARPAFFPKDAYVQVKAIGDARGDFTGRLLSDFRLDIDAANRLLGPAAGEAQLVSVHVPGSYAHWVSPGVCYNRVGYYEVPNSRIVYRQGGQTRSFGIASMISWRGVWYVIHLGAILRPNGGGVVDDPSTGPGSSVPSSTC